MKPRFPRIIGFLSKHYKSRLWLCVGISSLALLSESIGVLSILPIIATVIGQQNGTGDDPLSNAISNVFSALSLTPSLPLLLTVFFLGIMLKACLNLIAIQQAGYASAAVARDIRNELVSGLMQARWSHFINLRIGEMTNLVTGEPDRVAHAFPALVRFIAAVFQVLLYTILSFFASPAVAITAFTVGGLIFLCIRKLIHIYQQVCAEQARERSALADRVTQILNGFKSIKAMALEQRVEPLLTAGTERLSALYRKEILSKATLQSVFEPAFALCLCLGVIMFTVVYPQPLAQLMFMAILLQRLMSHMSTLQGAYQNLTAFDGILDQYSAHKSTLANVFENIRSVTTIPDWKEIRLENISFSYNETPVLKNISAAFPDTGLSVILGPSGTGKSTMLDILAGLQKPSVGRITLDGILLPYENIYAYRSHIGYLPQESVLLNDSIRQNITLGDARFTESDIKEAIEAAGLSETIAHFPEGIETIVGERGGRLSGGQRQRLMLARALLRKPSLLLLDEPLSALDTETSQALCNTLDKLKSHLAIIAVSHQKEILRVADNVYEMNKGYLQRK